VVDQVQPDGQVSLATALAAFAVAIGPVPGAVIPPGVVVPIGSGTIAVDWVLAKWGQLTLPQRQAVLTDLGVSQTASPPEPVAPAAVSPTAAPGTGTAGPSSGSPAPPTTPISPTPSVTPTQPTPTPSTTPTVTPSPSPSGFAHADAGPLSEASRSTGKPDAVLAAMISGGAAPSPDPNIACPGSDSAGAGPYRAQVAPIESAITSHIGGGAAFGTVYISVNTKIVVKPVGGVAPMYSIPCQGNHEAKGGTVDNCVIHTQPVSRYFDDADIHGLLIHELTHCLLYHVLGFAYYHMPPWYVEAVPEWVAAVVGGGYYGTAQSWEGYLQDANAPLFGRAYTAIGFYVHLAETGTDVWHVIIPMGEAFQKSGNSNIAGWNAAQVSPAFLDSWGSGYAEGRYPGSAWTSIGPGLATDPQPLPSGSINCIGEVLHLSDMDSGVCTQSSIPLSAGAAAANIKQVDIDATVVHVTATPGASGRISLGGGSDATLAQAAGVNYCASDANRPSCSCPPGSPNASAVFTPIESGLEWAGVTGGTQPATVTLTGESLPAFCGKPSPALATGKGLGCVQGTWTSTQERLSSSNGILLEGAAGEVMSISPDGSMTINYDRMAPIEDLSDPDAQFGIATFYYRGELTAQLTLPAGQAGTSGAWLGDQDNYSDMYAFLTVPNGSGGTDTAGPLPIGQMVKNDGLPDTSLPDGRFECSAHTLVITQSDTQSDSFSIVQTFTRTG